jgi:transposase
MDATKIIKMLTEQNIKLTKELNAQRLLTEKIQAQLDSLLRILYGKKSEKKNSNNSKASDNIDQDLENSKSNKSKTIGNTNKPVRKKLPSHLEREIIKYELTESERVCYLCGNICHCIGKEISEQLEFIPARLFIKEHRRYKYGCRNGCELKMATMPIQPIPKGIPGPGLLSEILINKYQDSLPLYRQSLRFKRYGIEIAESTLVDWVSQTAKLLEPLIKLMHKDIVRLSKLHTDDTIVPVLAKNKTKKGRLWVYIADGKSGPACTIYDYSSTRSQTAPQKFLTGFKGYLQADAYAGYDILYTSGDVIEVGCMAHVRRKFFEITESAKGESLAQDALDKIAKIYEIEEKCRGMHHLKRYFFRKKYLRIIYKKLYRWLKKKKKIIIPNTPIEKAFNYALNHWRALQNVFADGRLEVDNNIAERGMRIVALGRKNYLFAGSDQGGHNAAIIYSILETAKQNGLNIFEYLRDILIRLPSTEENEIINLLPYHYSK